jgi:hypothetical protein
MRKGVAVAVFLVVLVSTWLAYTKVTQSRRDASYRAAIALFQRDLHLAMDRADVRKYLDSQAVAYHSVRYGGNDADTYEIKIAEEPSHSLVCENWNVYVALEFTAADKLRALHIRKSARGCD